MATYRSSRIIPIVLTIVVIIVAIAGIVGLVRLLFTGSSSTDTASLVETNLVQENLLNTTDGRSVSMTVRGPIVADEDFRSYRIVISPTSRQFQAFKGYLDTVTSEQSLPNNTAAYSQFVNALDKANLAKGTPLNEEGNSLLGICATGKVYQFATIDAGTTQDMLWTSTCNGSRGSLDANINQVSQLFLNQIPDGSTITASLDL